MATRKSQHDHGPSEIWDKPGVSRSIAAEMKRIGARLRALRLERRNTQEQAAELIGIHPVHLQRIETGKANVTLGTLVAIVKAYRISLEELFCGEDVSGGPAPKRMRRKRAGRTRRAVRKKR